MKKLFTILLVLLSTTVFAKGLSVAVTSGYIMTAFEDQEEAAGTLPIGIQVGMKATPSLEVGLEVNNALGGFVYELDFLGTTAETTMNQTIASLYAKYFLGSSKMKPFVKAGVGMFTGNGNVKMSFLGVEDDEDFDIDSGVGFIVGAGLHITKAIFTEFNYNIVNRGSEGETSGMNTWSVLVGYKININ